MKLSEFINILNSKDEEEKEKLLFAVRYSRKAKPRDVFGFGDITKKTFYEVKEFQRLFSLSYDAAVTAVIDWLHDNKVKDPDAFDFFAFYNYIKSEVEKVNKIEEKLAYSPSVDEDIAGIDRFNQFGYFGQVLSICERFGWSLEYVKDLPYNTAFTILLYYKEQADFNKKITDIKFRK